MNKEKMLRDLFHESRTNLILGQKGAGKTNFTSVLMKELSYLGYDVWTNVHFFDYNDVGEACSKGKLPKGVRYQRVPPTIHVFSSLSELLYGLLEPGPKAVFLDEAGIVSHTGTSKDTKTVKQLAYIIRHFDCALTLITQVAGSVPPDLRDNLVDFRLKITKEGRHRVLTISERSIALDDFENEYINFLEVKTLHHLPKSRLPYDGDFPSTLEFDVDLKKALAELGKLKSSLELEHEGKEIIDKLIVDNHSNKITTKNRVIDLLESPKDMTYAEIAEIVDSSEGYVKQIGAKYHKEMGKVS